MALGPIYAANCAACCPHVPLSPHIDLQPTGFGEIHRLWPFKRVPAQLYMKKINIYIYIYILFCLFLKKEKKGEGDLCFLGEQRAPLSCPLLPLENLWGLGAAL